MSPCIAFTQPAKSCGKSDCGIGRPSHAERSAHICSTSSTSGGVTVVVVASGLAEAAGAVDGGPAGAPDASGACAAAIAKMGKIARKTRPRFVPRRRLGKRRTMLKVRRSPSDAYSARHNERSLHEVKESVEVSPRIEIRCLPSHAGHAGRRTKRAGFCDRQGP
jgi:hypothetical protein